MATRKTLEEIEALEKKWKSQFPGKKFHIEHSSGENEVFPAAVQYQNLTVSRWVDGKPWVAWESYELTELVTCPDCGKEWHNLAIGEDGSRCHDCAEAQKSVFKPVSSRPAYGDWDATGQSEGKDFWG